jgi:hypothetical protein
MKLFPVVAFFLILIFAISLFVHNAEAIQGIKVVKGKLTDIRNDNNLEDEKVGRFKMKVSDTYMIPIIKIEMNESPKEEHQYYVGFWRSGLVEDKLLSSSGSNDKLIVVKDVDLLNLLSEEPELVVTERHNDAAGAGVPVARASMPNIHELLSEFPARWESSIILQIASEPEMPAFVTERILPFYSLDWIEVWQIFPQWKRAEDSARWTISVTDEFGNNLKDPRALPHPRDPSIYLELVAPQSLCAPDNTLEIVELIPPYTTGVRRVDSPIFVKYELPGIRSDDGIYHLKFSSPHRVEIKLPNNAEMVSEDIRQCSLEFLKLTEVFAYEITFKLN